MVETIFWILLGPIVGTIVAGVFFGLILFFRNEKPSKDHLCEWHGTSFCDDRVMHCHWIKLKYEVAKAARELFDRLMRKR